LDERTIQPSLGAALPPPDGVWHAGHCMRGVPGQPAGTSAS
jgi:hypothetical protein